MVGLSSLLLASSSSPSLLTTSSGPELLPPPPAPSMSPPLLPRTATSSTSRLRSPAGQQASRSRFENILPSIIHRQPKAPQKALDTRYRRKFYLAGFVRRRQTETTFFFTKHNPIFNKTNEKRNIRGGIKEDKGERKQWRRSQLRIEPSAAPKTCQERPSRRLPCQSPMFCGCHFSSNQCWRHQEAS
ncbi:meiotic recombination protein DMC1-like protein [Iris pallida]|uniref:Meiotic recombination protein DMC1-like protein n=1 Tax=Iris pallida TaxID=29817 RepID=A0AAX6HCQ2_IRIPA|nr:meiotic recombination protein DMC1-like protein [Iris pallida]